MTRQLNPGLFGDVIGTSNSNQGAGLGVGFTSAAHSGSASGQESFAFYDDSSFMLADLEGFKKDFEKLRFDIQDSQKTTVLRNEKVFSRLHLLEERLNMIHKETHDKWTEINGRMRDRGMHDAKIEALIERHNQIVQSFELRISQAQRLIDNQTTQLSKQQQMIDDARRQIEKLKKL